MKKHSVIKLLGTAVAGLMLLMSLWGCISEAAPSPTGTNTAAPTPINTAAPTQTNTAAPTPTKTAAPGRVTSTPFDYDRWLDSLEKISPTFTPILFTPIPYVTPAPTANAEHMLKGNVRPVITCSIGTGENQLGYSAHRFGIRVPEYFYVDDRGWMAILDTYNKRIVIYDKADDGTYAYREEIALPATGDMSRMEYTDGVFYFVHSKGNQIVSIEYEHGKDNSQNELTWHNIPEPIYVVKNAEIRLEPLRYGGVHIYCRRGTIANYILRDGVLTESDANSLQLITLSWDWDWYSLFDSTRRMIQVCSLDTPIGSWSIVTRELFCSSDYIIGYDAQHSIYIYRDSEASFEQYMVIDGQIAEEDQNLDLFENNYQSFIKIDEHGNCLGKVSMPYSSYYQDMYRFNAISVTLDGKIYCMMCFPEQVIVYEIT